MSVRRAVWWLVPVFIGVTVLIFHRLALTDMILARGDTYVYFYPYRDALHESLRQGFLPLWTPDIFMGVPLLANPQVGTFYPVNWLTLSLSAPDAIRIQILLHITLAGMGASLLSLAMQPERERQHIFGAIIAGIIYAVGGHVGAHVEQINQLQALAWFPWLVLLLYQLLTTRQARWALLLAGAFCLQLFAGHTQTVFISGAGMGLFVLAWGILAGGPWQDRLRRTVIALFLLAGISLLTLLLASPQLLPTLEMTGLSNREGGFSVEQATAFSLPPTYLPAALLPNYDGQLFGEYVGYTGIIGLGLALWALLAKRSHNSQMRWLWLFIGAVGLFFAPGRFNPVYWFLADLPGFNFFRVPARWLALYALAVAMLAGHGLQYLLNTIQTTQLSLRGRMIRSLLLVGPVMVLIVLRLILPFARDDFITEPVSRITTLVLWGGAILFLLVIVNWRMIPGLRAGMVGGFAVLAVVIELLLASLSMPYNDLAPPDVYEGQRFTISQLQAYADEQIPPQRHLSISRLLFEVGDKARLDARFARYGMDERAVEAAYRAIKWQTVVYPNLGLAHDVPQMDGFGGGLLPTGYYSQFTSLLLPQDSLRSADGRIGETMARDTCRGACLPDPVWLAMTNTGYVIVDKVYDLWLDGIAYDTALTFTDGILYDPESPDFIATHLHLLYQGDDLPDLLTEASENNDPVSVWESLPVSPVPDRLDDFNLIRVPLTEMPGPVRLQTDDSIVVQSATLVDARTGAFIQLTPADWTRVLSTEIKVYYREPLPRVRLVRETRVLPDTWQGGEDALIALQEADDPTQIVYLHSDTPDTIETGVYGGEGSVTIAGYTDTDIIINVETDSTATVLLSDAWYPGWQATLNGEPLPVYRANVMFRAVQVPSGEHVLRFRFQMTTWYEAGLIGGLAWSGLMIAGVFLFFWHRGQALSSNQSDS